MTEGREEKRGEAMTPQQNERRIYEQGQKDALSSSEADLIACRLAALNEAAEVASPAIWFGMMRREELTYDFGKPRYDMCVRIMQAIHNLATEKKKGSVKRWQRARTKPSSR